jgi:uncharacterized protein YegJ (DUF2314 family)
LKVKITSPIPESPPQLNAGVRARPIFNAMPLFDHLPRLCLGIAWASGLLGCGPSEARAPRSAAVADSGVLRTVDENGDSVWVTSAGDTIHGRDPDDPDLLRAQQDAHCSLDEFRRRLLEPPSTQTELAFKVPVSDSVATAHLWFEALAFVDDSAIRGVLEVTPVTVRDFRKGDTLVFPLRMIEDWMADDRDTVVGGFSIRVDRDRMNRAQRAQYDSASGYNFGPDEAHWRRYVAGCRGATLLGAAGP